MHLDTRQMTTLAIEHYPMLSLGRRKSCGVTLWHGGFGFSLACSMCNTGIIIGNAITWNDGQDNEAYDRGFSCEEDEYNDSSMILFKLTFFSFHKARRPTPETFTTLKRTPGISPLALPLRPKPEMRTSSFSSTKFKQPSFCINVLVNSRQVGMKARTGTKAVTFLPFLISCTRTHLRMAELGCLASTPTFSRTMPFACDDPPVGEVL